MNAYEYLQELVRISKKIESGELDALSAVPLLKAAVEKRERYAKEHPEENNRPHNPECGEVVRRGTTEWDVFHKLSMRRLKRNGIHL